jgi:endonuclease YncB( thermonuclease family)
MRRENDRRKYTWATVVCGFNRWVFGIAFHTDRVMSGPIFSIALAASLALAVSFSAWADFTGKVVGVADGDSITVLRDRQQVKVRLVEIDAPESGQPFGNRSKRALADLVKGQQVLVVERGHDNYQRTLGRVYRGDLDVSAEQVRQGMAWVFRQYAKDATLYPIEAEAKEQKRGLWRDPEPEPDWCISIANFT